MKYRSCFVTNSSSSSFTIRKDKLTLLQIYAIKNHIKVAQILMNQGHEEDAWSIYDDDYYIEGHTNMDNFDMEEFFELIDVPPHVVRWG